MGAYKRSPTWSKEGDPERDAAVRAQWRKISKDPATLTRACAPAMQQAARELTKALVDFVDVGLDDLDACAGANAALGASLARRGVVAADFDGLLERVLAEADAALGVEFDAVAKQRWASAIDVFCGQCAVGVGPPSTPKSALGSPKPKKKSYTGGMYKKFAVSVGLKKAKSPVTFNLEASASVASPGQGPAPRERGNGGPAASAADRFGVNSRNATPITAGPVPAVQPRSKRAVARAARRDRGFERFFAALAWAILAAVVACVARYPEVTAAHTRAALYLGRHELLYLVVFGFFLRPTLFARVGCVAAALVAARTVAGFGYGVEAAKDPWRAAAPYVCFAPWVCDNGLTKWVRLVALGE